MSSPSSVLTWADAVGLLAQQTGVVMLVGATDVGKSTLALTLGFIATIVTRRRRRNAA